MQFIYVIHQAEVFFTWDSLHARLSSHYKAWHYKKNRQKEVVVKQSQSGLTSGADCAFLALVGHASSYGGTIKNLFKKYFVTSTSPAPHLLLLGLLKLNFDFM